MEGRKFTDAAKALAFINAGNAIFTLVSLSTGNRYTFQVTIPSDQKQEKLKIPMAASTPFRSSGKFVRLLTGPDNNSDYTYLGMLDVANTLRLTRASKMNRDALPVKALDYTLAMLIQQKRIPTTLEIWHEGRCGRCGRRLTVPTSIEAGIGPECAGLMQ